MTDVRLTALNPEDSKVYPVACNSSGELLTTKQGDNPIVPGDLTVEGSIIAAGGTVVITGSGNVKTGDPDNNIGSVVSPAGYNYARRDSGGSADFGYALYNGGNSPADIVFSAAYDGSIIAAGDLTIKSNILVKGSDGSGIFVRNKEDTAYTIDLNEDGSADLAGKKAGFTAEGHLWCTTRRGETVILDALANGLGTWADYTPPTRRDVIADKLKDAKPGVSQELPETQ